METKCFFKVFLAILSDADLGFTFTIIAIVKTRPSNQRAKAMIGTESSLKTPLAMFVRTLQSREQYIEDYHCLLFRVHQHQCFAMRRQRNSKRRSTDDGGAAWTSSSLD